MEHFSFPEANRYLIFFSDKCDIGYKNIPKILKIVELFHRQLFISKIVDVMTKNFDHQESSV